MLIQETTTALSADEVLRRAIDHFQAAHRHAAGLERRGETWVRFRSDVGTVLVAALPGPDGATRVRATAARQWGQVGRFLAGLGEPNDARAELRRRGASLAQGSLVEGAPPPRLERLAAA